MQNFNTRLILAVCMLLSFSVFSQDRYLGEVFDDVQVTTDVKYGENATVLFLTSLGMPVKEDLLMDIYEPMGDTDDKRALVVLLHTGNFLPRTLNGGMQGTKSDSSAVEIATRLAKMGYVVASADYRLGWNPGAETQPLRALGLIQAAYRGIQDGRSCVRFFKSDADNDDNYRIDPNRIALWGNGTGGYIALGMVTLNTYNEILTTTNPANKFIFDNMGTPTPMVVESFHGDIEGKNLTIAPANGFGFTAGDTTNYSNHPDYSSDVQLALNVGGALGDISWITAGEAPIISYHHYLDPFAPYESDVLKVPGSGLLIVEIQGSKLIADKQNELGNNDVFVDAAIDDDWTTAAGVNSTAAGHDFSEALYPVVNPANPLQQIEGVVIDWWDPEAVPPNYLMSNPMNLPWNQLPNMVADPTGMTTYHEAGLFQNFGMSPEKAKTNIDTLIGFFAPRAYAALDLATVDAQEIDAAQVGLSASPNPALDVMQISAEQNIKHIFVYDMTGKLVKAYVGVNNLNYEVRRADLGSGLYVAQVHFEEGVVAEKIVFN